MTFAHAKFEVAMSKGLGDAFTKKTALFGIDLGVKMLLDLGVKVTQNVDRYPVHHVTYAPAKFEVEVRPYV